MKKISDEFFIKSYRKALQSYTIKNLENSAESNRKKLKESLSKEQRVLLLRTLDANHLITEECSEKCFIAGFKLGLVIGYEANRD